MSFDAHMPRRIDHQYNLSRKSRICNSCPGNCFDIEFCKIIGSAKNPYICRHWRKDLAEPLLSYFIIAIPQIPNLKNRKRRSTASSTKYFNKRELECRQIDFEIQKYHEVTRIIYISSEAKKKLHRDI